MVSKQRVYCVLKMNVIGIDAIITAQLYYQNILFSLHFILWLSFDLRLWFIIVVSVWIVVVVVAPTNKVVHCWCTYDYYIVAVKKMDKSGSMMVGKRSENQVQSCSETDPESKAVGKLFWGNWTILWAEIFEYQQGSGDLSHQTKILYQDGVDIWHERLLDNEEDNYRSKTQENSPEQWQANAAKTQTPKTVKIQRHCKKQN